ncbi:hypothetical protein CYY_001603 [Polysphondylium violaceum]|uniref:PLAC8 family protein n=1 Tax=Polysphondylium violaceum TaxID=133409 RepID=A0A8J4Q312_9MYCE|nr:hypothetical protein CYY_001603 [Polysphondylium violaceum]
MSGWEYGLCDCTSDCRVCCISYLWPALQVMQQRATVDGRECEVTDCLITALCFPCAICMTRGAIRDKHGIEGSAFMDCLLTCYCTLCVIHQNTMQLKSKGEKPAGIFMS